MADTQATDMMMRLKHTVCAVLSALLWLLIVRLWVRGVTSLLWWITSSMISADFVAWMVYLPLRFTVYAVAVGVVLLALRRWPHIAACASAGIVIGQILGSTALVLDLVDEHYLLTAAVEQLVAIMGVVGAVYWRHRRERRATSREYPTGSA